MPEAGHPETAGSFPSRFRPGVVEAAGLSAIKAHEKTVDNSLAVGPGGAGRSRRKSFVLRPDTDNTVIGSADRSYFDYREYRNLTVWQPYLNQDPIDPGDVRGGE